MAPQVEEDRSLLVPSESEESEIEVPKTSSSKRRVIAVVVGLAVVGLVAYAAASQQAGQSLRSGNVQNTEILAADKASGPSTYYFVKSTWKDKGAADEYWKFTNGVVGSKEKSKKANDEDTELGLHFMWSMPTGKDKTTYGIWEAKHGVGKAALDKHLNNDKETTCGKMGSYFDNEISEIDTKLSGPMPWSFFNPPSRRLAEEESQYYLVHHTFKDPKDSKAWWKDLGKIMKDKDFKEKMQKMKEDGFTNPFFAPLSPEGPIYCLWKVSKGKTEDDLQKLLDSTTPTSKLHNVPMLIPNALTGGYPGPFLPQ